MKVHEIFDFLNEKYPVDTACDFDNVGILVGDPQSEVSRVTVALDCTKAAIKFAKKNGCELMVTHHPVIFDPLKTVTADSVVYDLIASGISVISMHTNLDVGLGGVNDCLCETLALSDTGKFVCEDGYQLNRGTLPRSMSDEELAQYLKEKLGGAVVYTQTYKSIKTVAVCSGSGGRYWQDAQSNGFDALITADIKHDVWIAASNADFPLFDAGHFYTEDVVVEPLADLLRKKIPNLTVLTDHSYKIKHI